MDMIRTTAAFLVTTSIVLTSFAADPLGTFLQDDPPVDAAKSVEEKSTEKPGDDKASDKPKPATSDADKPEKDAEPVDKPDGDKPESPKNAKPSDAGKTESAKTQADSDGDEQPLPYEPRTKKPIPQDKDELLAEWKAFKDRREEIGKRITALQRDFFSPAASRARKLKIKSEVDQLIEEWQTKIEPRMVDLSVKVLEADPEDVTAGAFLLDRNHYAQAIELTERLMKAGTKTPAVVTAAVRANFNSNNFDRAAELAVEGEEQGLLYRIPGRFYPEELPVEIPKYQEYWEREQELREEEDQAGDDAAKRLPRVALQTDRGPIVLELFENQAPNTVANFISLVEKDFYDGTSFHNVVDDSVVEGGDPNSKDDDPSDDGTGGPGYTIKSEGWQSNARKHFRGSLSMANNGRDTGGSRFFLARNPTDRWNAKEGSSVGHTVFGRVVKGMPIVDAMKQGDKLIKAKVLVKRNHEYKPRTSKDPEGSEHGAGASKPKSNDDAGEKKSKTETDDKKPKDNADQRK